MGQEGYRRVDHPQEVAQLLEGFSRPGGAALELVSASHGPLPVVVTLPVPGEPLLLDISAIREVVGELRRGAAFRLCGEHRGKRVRTSPLVVEACREAGGRLLCRCPQPEELEVLQRRDTYRARLRLGMEAGAILRGDETDPVLQGDLKDLSLEGCRLELPLQDAGLLASSAALELELCFPNGTRFAMRARVQHHRVDAERQAILAGFQFLAPSEDRQRQLWYCVREIEREAVRQAGELESVPPSPLFQGRSLEEAVPVGRRHRYATAMARRLGRVAGYLDAQLLELRGGEAVDAIQLSRQADRLLILHDEDREATLFATRCLFRESPLVQHGIAVAVQLLDLAGATCLPRGLRKAVAACGLVHDLGKALVAPELLRATELSVEQRAELQRHVAMLRPRLASCRWLAESVVAAVVEEINERLDGSGYPAGLAGERLHELSRLAMVVDAVDAMRRERPDRPAWPIADVYRHLLSQPQAYDPRWVKRYIQHFGLIPIGSLVRFESGALGWVQRLDEAGRPAQVQLTEALVPPERLGEVCRGDRLARLGEISEEIPLPGSSRRREGR